MTNLIYGMHDPCPESILPEGYILHPVEVGDTSYPHPGIDFYELIGARTPICRIQYGWGDMGCLPLPEKLNGFLKRVETLIFNSTGCKLWTIANEPNRSAEWPRNVPLQPEYVAHVYNLCREITNYGMTGHKILLPAVGPWNVESGYDWIEYFVRMIAACDNIDGFALHTYSRGSDPRSITSTTKMDPPYDHLYSGFLTYKDFMSAIPEIYYDRPAYITETNQNQAWVGGTGWIETAYAEIDRWNLSGSRPQIHAMCLYCYANRDEYCIATHPQVLWDFRDVQLHGYRVPGDEPPSTHKHHLVVTLDDVVRLDEWIEYE